MPFQSSCGRFGLLSTTNTTPPTPVNDALVVKYDASGGIQWGRKISSQGVGWDITESGLGQSITTDSSENVYVTGTSAGPLTVFGTDNTTPAFSLGFSGTSDIFIVKYNSSGVPQWARRIAGPTIDQGNGIGIDSTGNVYVMGLVYTEGNVYEADDTTVAFAMPYNGVPSIMTVKYSSSGTPLWMRWIDSTGNNQGTDLAVDSSGNVFLSGSMQQAYDMYIYDASGSVAITLTTTSDAWSGFVVKYDTDGTPQWGRMFIGLSVFARAITTDSSGNIYILGFFNNTDVTFYGGTSSITLPYYSTDNGFLVKYDTTGEPIWARGTDGADGIKYSVATDGSDNVYITGLYAGTLTIRNDDGTVFVSDTGSGSDSEVGIIKYDTDGTPQWFRRIGSSGNDQGNGISADSTGNVFVTGYYSALLTVFNGDGITTGTTAFTTLANSGSEDGFVVKYNTSGTPQWATRIGGTGSDILVDIKVGSSGNIYVMGKYTSHPVTVFSTGSSITLP